MNLEAVFQGITKKMLIDFEEITSQINHRGAKGKVRERGIITEYLTKYLPGNISAENGEIISTDGQISPETDIVLFDNFKAPVLLSCDGYRVFPNEVIYSVIEVKSMLNSNELKNSILNIAQIKRMPKTAFEQQKGPLMGGSEIYGKTWPYFPTNGFIFAYDSIDLDSLKDVLISETSSMLPEHRVDSIWVLKKGMIVNFIPGKDMIDISPSTESIYRSVVSENPLMLFTVQIQSLMQSTWMPFFLIKHYLGNANFGRFK